MANTSATEDRFTQKLQEEKRVLERCQEEHNVSTCNDCDKIIGCEIRRSYVMAVYESMSKGETGGFEF